MFQKLILICIIIAFFALLGSSRILYFLERIELLGSAVLFAFIATILYSMGYILHRYRESDRYMSGAIYFLAVGITQVSVWFFIASQVNQDTGIEKTSENFTSVNVAKAPISQPLLNVLARENVAPYSKYSNFSDYNVDFFLKFFILSN